MTSLIHMLLSPDSTIVSLLVVLTILTFCLCLIPESNVQLLRTLSLAVSMIPLF